MGTGLAGDLDLVDSGIGIMETRIICGMPRQRRWLETPGAGMDGK